MILPTPRRSTWVIAALFVLTSVFYLVVRPAPRPAVPNSPMPVFIVPTTLPEPLDSVPPTTNAPSSTVPGSTDAPVPPTVPPPGPTTLPPTGPTTIDPATDPTTTPAPSSLSEDTIGDAGSLIDEGSG